jgi:hypothetical protein
VVKLNKPASDILQEFSGFQSFSFAIQSESGIQSNEQDQIGMGRDNKPKDVST